MIDFVFNAWKENALMQVFKNIMLDISPWCMYVRESFKEARQKNRNNTEAKWITDKILINVWFAPCKFPIYSSFHGVLCILFDKYTSFVPYASYIYGWFHVIVLSIELFS